jgi:branched-chain amino acid transport system substrate-binding protein
MATQGISTQNGIAMAQDKVNKAGGVLGRKIQFLVEDDRGLPEEAQTVVTRLITKYGVSAILGETTSSRTLAAAPIAQQNHIPMVTPDSTNPRVTKVGDYIFRTCFTDAFPSSLMAKFVSNNLGIKKLAILRDIRNDYSVDLAVFTQDFKKTDGVIVADESYGEGDTNFSAQLTKIKSRGAQGIFVPGYYTEIGLIARQARQLGLTVPLLGGGSWDSPKLLEIAGESLEGAYYSLISRRVTRGQPFRSLCESTRAVLVKCPICSRRWRSMPQESWLMQSAAPIHRSWQGSRCARRNEKLLRRHWQN